jgi:predicted  nucleic acid-binding Zn-ribbon protein
MTQKDKILLQLSDKKNVSIEFAVFDTVEALADKVLNKLIAFEKLKSELSTNGSALKSLYDKAEKSAKELGVEDSQRRMPEATKTIGKLKMAKLL